MDELMLEQKALSIRRDIIEMLYRCQSGHPGGSLSCVEILIALYYAVAHVDPTNPSWEMRDRIVLSKGHGCPALYAILADKGFFPRNDLWNLRQIDSHLQGHPDMRKTPGIDVSTGSLGQGASVAVGLALAAKYKRAPYHVYVVLGDGEIQEGMVWEATMSAAHYKLDNLIFILDHNGLQIDGTNDQVMSLGDIIGKFHSFGFECKKVDGHNVDMLVKAISEPVPGKPLFVLAETVKGRGISFMENNVGWHGKPMNTEEYNQAMCELKGTQNV
ncbi:MAG TPA: transketolase [Rectinema sp.]|nr:transketolase [Rectinema sp.]